MSRVTATELDYRESGWIEVSLLWDRETDELVVSVRDTASGDAFEIAVENNANALDVFHHPYAYAPEPIAAASARRGARGSAPKRPVQRF